MEDDKKIIEEELFIKDEERQVNTRELARGINKYLKIDPITKQTIFLDELKKLSNYKAIAVLLTGVYLGHKAGIFDKNSLTLSELSERMREKQTTLSAPVNQLIKDHFVIPTEDSKNRVYRVNDLSIKVLLDKINFSDKKDKK